MIHFSEIMVVTCEPKDRDTIYSRSGRFVGEFHCGEGLVDIKHRSAEKPHLLAGHECSCAFAQTVKIGKSFRRRAPGFVLAFEDIGDFLAARGIVTKIGGLFLHPVAKLWRSRIEGLDVVRI